MDCHAENVVNESSHRKFSQSNIFYIYQGVEFCAKNFFVVFKLDKIALLIDETQIDSIHNGIKHESSKQQESWYEKEERDFDMAIHFLALLPALMFVVLTLQLVEYLIRHLMWIGLGQPRVASVDPRRLSGTCRQWRRRDQG